MKMNIVNKNLLDATKTVLSKTHMVLNIYIKKEKKVSNQ
jgi:hypothetical protein